MYICFFYLNSFILKNKDLNFKKVKKMKLIVFGLLVVMFGKFKFYNDFSTYLFKISFF